MEMKFKIVFMDTIFLEDRTLEFFKRLSIICYYYFT